MSDNTKTMARRYRKKPILLSFHTTADGRDEIDRLADAAMRKRSEYINLAARGLIPVDRSVLVIPDKK